ncbi:acyltransferase family protein [Sphingobium phenoxybenzoativorans]|uniref:acyltransferase family protein n=1 Tax=Sphingobium phenoxybenzoativorans TaxID=1592790 RepID=UPI00087206EA|nr:acyltransferase family protein [Sphingobium phenoxybenzoativorans]
MGGERAAAAQRYEWVDVARGIGIVAVVIGHVWSRGLPHTLTYSFHMPLFFLLSGYLFRPKPVVAFARSQIVWQGLSYCAFLALLVAVDTLIEGSRGGRGIFHTWPQDLGRLAFGGSKLRGPFTVFWFVPCLIFARILFNALAARFPDPLGKAWWFIAPMVLAVAYLLGWVTDVSPLGLLTVPMALFLLWAGAALNVIGWRGWMLWLLPPLSIAGLFFLPALNMKGGDYGWPLLSMAGAIATSLLIFRASHWGGGVLKPFSALGRASLVIMYLHVPVIHYLSYLPRPWILALATVIPLLVYYLLNLTRPTRAVFLGQPK